MSTYTEYAAKQQKSARLSELARTHRCTCGGELNVAYRDDDWHLRCGKCGILPEEAALERLKGLVQAYREGAALPLTIANRLERKIGGRHMDSKALMATTEQGMMQRIERAKFPQELKPEEKRTLAMAAITYGFDPLMGELTIFQGRPYVSIDGRYRKARETNKLDGVRTRPATEQERKDWSIPVDDYFFKAEVFVKGASYPFEGWGRVRNYELTERSKYHPERLASPVVADNPQRMAEKRAEAQALRKAFSIPLPSAEDIGWEESAFEVKVIENPDAETQKTGMKTANGTNPPPEAGNALISGAPVDVNGLFAEAWKQRKLSRKQLLVLARVKDDGDIKLEMIAGIWARVLEQPMQMVQEEKS